MTRTGSTRTLLAAATTAAAVMLSGCLGLNAETPRFEPVQINPDVAPDQGELDDVVIGSEPDAEQVANPAPDPESTPTEPAPTEDTDSTSNEATAPEDTPAQDAGPQDPTAAFDGTASSALDLIPVKGRAPKTGYDRDLFGPAWTDASEAAMSRNGCDTRNDILTRDLDDPEYKPDTNGCVVLFAHLDDPYTGTEIPFERGRGTSNAVQIDHVVALSDAWQKGAQSMTEADRTNLANDPLNLIAVDGPTNAAKGDGDAATWLPPNKPYRCAYVARQVAVKHKYGLWVTQAEADAIRTVLDGCPDFPLPTDADALLDAGDPVSASSR